jgi:hypothetical protein
MYLVLKFLNMLITNTILFIYYFIGLLGSARRNQIRQLYKIANA